MIVIMKNKESRQENALQMGMTLYKYSVNYITNTFMNGYKIPFNFTGT